MITTRVAIMAHGYDGERLRREKPGLTLLDDASLNAEAPLSRLDAAITPVDAFFVRNNGRVPRIEDIGEWTLTIDGCVSSPRSFSLDALRSAFEAVTVTAVLECAGNNRAGFDPPTDGLAWGRGAVGCARWTGVRMRDLLHACGLAENAVYTAHHSPDLAPDGRPAISRGIPIARALAPDTLIAWAMNDADLAPLHGAPLRVVAPGMPGSAWQKWISRLEIRDRVHDGEKMNGTDYRLPRRPVRPGERLDTDLFEVIESMPVNAVMTRPPDGARVGAGAPFEIAGFAWSGQAPVARVDISMDGGRTWRMAELGPEAERFAWRRFSLSVDGVTGRSLSILARATDEAGHVQPIGQASWNPRGYCNNAAHRITVFA